MVEILSYDEVYEFWRKTSNIDGGEVVDHMSKWMFQVTPHKEEWCFRRDVCDELNTIACGVERKNRHKDGWVRALAASQQGPIGLEKTCMTLIGEDDERDWKVSARKLKDFVLRDRGERVHELLGEVDPRVQNGLLEHSFGPMV
jgi:hypothetical protein